MAKKGSAPFVKKLFPGLTRITKQGGERVWLFEGKEFKTKAQILDYVIEENKKKEAARKVSIPDEA